MSVDTSAPRDASRYASFEQDDMCIYYTPQIARRSSVLELDYVRVLFRSRPQLSGPEELLATIVLGHL